LINLLISNICFDYYAIGAGLTENDVPSTEGGVVLTTLSGITGGTYTDCAIYAAGYYYIIGSAYCFNT